LTTRRDLTRRTVCITIVSDEWCSNGMGVRHRKYLQVNLKDVWTLMNHKDKNKRIQLLNDLGRFKGKKITLTFIDGKSLTGRLASFDEVGNCVLKKCGEWVYGESVVCLGRSIVLVCMGTPHVL
jgi:U6 snRNA-associated Sm-like protein LSm7